MYYDPEYLIANGKNFFIKDKGHMKNTSRAEILAEYHEMPQGLAIDLDTYMAGSLHFKLKEIEVYQVI